MIPVVWATQVYPRDRDDFLGGFLHRLARELPSRGFSLRVVAPHAEGIALEEERDGVLIRRFRYAREGRQTLAYTGEMHRAATRHPLRFAAFLLNFRQAVQAELRAARPAIAHAHWWVPSGLTIAGLAARSGIPLLVSIHGTDLRLAAKNPLARLAARWVLRRASCVLPVSSSLEQEIHRLELTTERTEVLSMPADAEVFRPASGLTDSPGVSDPAMGRFVVAARLTAQKRVDFALRAASRLVAWGVPFRFEIVGDGPERRSLEELAGRLGIADRVVFHGIVPATKLAELYRAAAGVVLTSEREGYGLTLVEGALCGTAGVGVRSGGIEELIEPGETGFLVAPDDEEGLAAALRMLATDPEQAARLGRRARERMQPRTAGAVADRLAELYRSLAGAARLDGLREGP